MSLVRLGLCAAAVPLGSVVQVPRRSAKPLEQRNCCV